MTSRRVAVVGLLAVGWLAGIASACVAYMYANRDTLVYTANTQLHAGGIVIPAGTELVHDTFMSEGFDCLRLHINVDPITLEQRFESRRDDRGGLVIPYWVETVQGE